MAMTVTLGPASGTGLLTLTDHTKHALAANGFRSTPTLEAVLESFPGVDGARLVSHRAVSREINLMMHLAGTSHDNLISNWQNLVNMLRKAALYNESNIGEPIEFRYKWNNATNVVVFDVISGTIQVPVIEDSPLISSYLFDTPLVLVCQPFGRSTTATDLVYGGGGNYTPWTPTAIVGDVRPPARLRIRNLTSGTQDYIRVALRSRGNVANFISRFQPKASPTGYTTTKPSSRAVYNADALHLDVTYASLLSDNGFEGSYSGPTLGSELVGNGTFTTDLTGWADSSAGAASVVSAALAITSPGGNGSSSMLSQSVPTVAGTAYRFTVVMSNAVVQGAGTGAKVTLVGAGISSTPNPLISTAYSKVLVESSTTPTTHTWDFVAEGSTVSVRLYNDGNSTATFDNVSLKTIKALAPGWTLVGSSIGHYQAVDSEGETAGSRVYVGSSAQGFGTGDPVVPNLTHTWTAAVGVTYRVSVQMKRTGGTGNVHMGVGVGTPTLNLTCQSPSFVTVEGTYTATNTTVTVYLWCDAGTGGIVDNIIITPNDASQNELIRFTITTNIADFQGQFRVYARCKTTVNPFELQVRSGGPNGDRSLADSVTVPSASTYQEVSLGRVNIPERDLPFGQTMASFSFGIWLVPSAMGDVSASSTLEIWDVELVPIDEAFWELICPTGQGPAVNEYAVIDTQARIPLTYLTDSSGNHKASLPHGGSRLQLPIGAFQVYMHVAPSLTNDPVGGTVSYSADIQYYERRDIFR